MLFSSTEELKAHIGFLYASVNFENMKTYISMAERNIKRLTGNAVYKLAADFYALENKEEATDKELLLELLNKLQLPIALMAYYKYAPGTDLSHGETGRKMVNAEAEKSAFEWMIDRDDANTLNLAYEATDILLEWLDEQLIPVTVEPEEEGGEPSEVVNIIGTTWGGSTEYDETKELFINSAAVFDDIFPISKSRRLYLTLVPFIKEAERRFIEPAITTARYEEIKENIKDLEALDDDEKKILELAKVPVVMMTLSIALKRLSMELLPDRVVQHYSEINPSQNRTADSMDRRGLAALFEKDARRELVPLQNFIASLNTEVVEEEDEVDTNSPFFMS